MDLDLARTFLEIANAGTLVRAAARLHITQATVSTRLQTLEAEVGRQLFVRNKAGARLTPAGHDLIPYATQLLHVWKQASLKLAEDQNAMLTLGGEHSLWSALLLNWLVCLRRDRPLLTLRTQVDTPSNLLDAVQQGSVDAAIMYSPHRRAGVTTELVLEEELVAVTTKPCSHLGLDNYVYVDWGPDFASAHEARLPELSQATTRIGLGPLALRYILEVGGSGYFRTRAVEPYLASGDLHLVKKAPQFSYSLYAATSEASDPALLTWARERLGDAAEMPSTTWA